MLYLPLPLDGSEPLERYEVDPGDPGDGGDPRPHDVSAAVAGDLAQQLREVLLRVEQAALVLRVDRAKAPRWRRALLPVLLEAPLAWLQTFI